MTERFPFRSSSRCGHKKPISFLSVATSEQKKKRHTDAQGELIDMHVADTVLTTTCVTMAFNNATNCGRLSAASLDSCANTRQNTRKSANAQLIAGQPGLASVSDVRGVASRLLPGAVRLLFSFF